MKHWRFFGVQLLLLFLLLGLLSRLLYLQVLDVDRGHQYLQRAGDQHALMTEINTAYRGMISDRQGRPLAVSTPVLSVWLNPQKFIEFERLSELAQLLDLAEEPLRDKIERHQRKEFIYLKRHLPPSIEARLDALDINGVEARTEYKRFYPEGEVAAHILGFTDIDDTGLEGLEFAYDRHLQGESGSRRVLRSRTGQIIQHIDSVKQTRHGGDIALSIDLRLQHLAYRELQRAMAKYKSRSASIVLLDANTNKVLAMANQPSYNPNASRTSDLSSTRNRAMTDLVEPGSTMKPLTMIAALESGRYSAHSQIDTSPGWLNVEGKRLEDFSNYGVLSLEGIIKKSSQVGTSLIALSLEDGAVRDVMARMGVGERLGTNLPAERLGRLPNYDSWHPLLTVTMAYGYGLSMSTLQLADIYATLARGGIKKPVSILQGEEPVAGWRVADKDIVEQVQLMLSATTDDGGTATGARIAGYPVAGKTGTLHRLGDSGYEGDRYVAVFAGYAPADDPKIVAAIVLDDPKGEHYYGGEVAAPLFSTVVGDSLRMLSVTPSGLKTASLQW